ncbi:MAG: glycosyltransferase family 4 protein [Planctomycetia bacterium]|nr:glycosyltransferase family 4 protein [Planctomycetia bacterium]
MNIWYDVTGLTHWDRPQLTGIQRTTVGILNGLLARKVAVRTVWFDPRQGEFVPLDIAALPAAVRRHIDATAAVCGQIDAPATDAAPSESQTMDEPRRATKRWINRDTIFGTAPAANDLRVAFRQFKAAWRNLRRHATRWARTRWSPVHVTSPPSPSVTGLPAGTTFPQPAAPLGGDGPFAPGDVLFSLGCTWCMPGHAEAAAAARRRGVRVLRMIYDLIPAIQPQWVAPEHTREFTRWARSVLTESDHVFTISEFSRREIEGYCHECRFDPPPLSVVRLGDVLDTAAGIGEAAPLPRFVPTRPFFVCVSTLDVRKNHRLLYDVWSVLAARGPEACPDLLCIGTSHLYVDDLFHEIRHDRAVNGRIHVLQSIDDRELSWYYAHCAATIYPSRYEGWGLPVAESLGHGKLCLASHAASIPEISRTLPEFFDPRDPQGLVALVDRVLHDPAWVAERERAIHESFEPTPWTHTARQLLEAIGTASTTIPDAA